MYGWWRWWPNIWRFCPITFKRGNWSIIFQWHNIFIFSDMGSTFCTSSLLVLHIYIYAYIYTYVYVCMCAFINCITCVYNFILWLSSEFILSKNAKSYQYVCICTCRHLNNAILYTHMYKWYYLDNIKNVNVILLMLYV